MTVRKDTRILQQLIRQTPERVDLLARAAAEEMVGDIVLSFGASPSAPGEPPGVDTGTLRASMSVSKGEDRQYVIHDGVEYGVWLEFGTEKMAARPFVGPEFERWRQGEFARFARDFGVLEP